MLTHDNDVARSRNVMKLRWTTIPMNFVNKTGGVWSDQEFKEFCKNIEKKGYAPLDLDQVKSLLEGKK